MFHRNAVSQQKFDTSASDSDTVDKTQSNNTDNQTKDQPAMNAQDNKAENEAQKNDGAQARVDIPGAGGFQRPGQPPVANRAPGAYPGAYPGSYGQSSASAATPGLGADGNRKLVIGQGITLSGEIESCDYLIVEGTVEAALKGASRMDITENGAFFGTVEIDEATIAGRFEGDLTVKGRLTIRSTGTIIGSVAYKELAVEAGATLDGKVNPLDGSKAQSSNKKFANKQNKPQDNSAELPFGQKASA